MIMSRHSSNEPGVELANRHRPALVVALLVERGEVEPILRRIVDARELVHLELARRSDPCCKLMPDEEG